MKVKYDELINLIKSIPKDCLQVSIEIAPPCSENRSFLRVCVFFNNQPEKSDKKIFFMLEVFEVKESLLNKIWLCQYEIAALKKLKSKKGSFVSIEAKESIIVFKGTEEYLPVICSYSNEGLEYEKTRVETVQTLPVTKELYEEIKNVWTSSSVVIRDKYNYLMIETIDGKITIIGTDGHVMTVRDTGINGPKDLNFAITLEQMQALLMPHWDHEKTIEIQLSAIEKKDITHEIATTWECDLLICQKGKGKVLFPKLNVRPIVWRSITERIFSYGNLTIKLPTIPKGVEKLKFEWSLNESGKSVLSVQQSTYRMPESETEYAWKGEAEILGENQKFFTPDKASLTWYFNCALFSEGVRLTDSKDGIKLHVSKEPDDTVDLCRMEGNGYKFYIMPLNL